jgi:hypothetical protein
MPPATVSIVAVLLMQQQPLEAVVYTDWGSLNSVAPDGKRAVRCRRLQAGRGGSAPEAGEAAWNRTGTKLVVDLGRHEQPRELEILDRRCKSELLLERSAGSRAPIWSGDGTKIYAATGEAGEDRTILRVWNARGVRLPDIRLTGAEPFRFIARVSLSPSGEQVAAMLDARKISIGSFEGSELRITTTVGFDFVEGPAWIDERTVVVIGEHEGRRGLWQLDVSRGSRMFVNIEGFNLFGDVTVSPSRSDLAFCAVPAGADETSYALWRYSLRRKSMRRLAASIDPYNPAPWWGPQVGDK